MIKKTDSIILSQVFSRDVKKMYKIPMFQRPFVWDKKKCNLLFSDIIENGQNYFLGSFICVDLGDNKYEVVDGQQRITALSILLIALYDIIKEENFERLGRDIKSIIKEELVYYDGTEFVPRLQLQETEHNDDDYKLLLHRAGLISKPKVNNNFGNRRIARAYEYFKVSIENNLTERSPKSFNELFDLINSIAIIFIEVSSDQDAYMLFESLNNRGEPLSAIDLIKNKLIRAADVNRKVEKAYERWLSILNYLGEDSTIQERFARQYYNAFREEINVDFRTSSDNTRFPIGNLATRSTVLDIYDKLIKKDYSKFLKDFEDKARLYSILINNADSYEEIEDLKKSLLDLEHIQGAPSYILLLYILANKDRLNLSYCEINEIVEYLVKFFVRRNFTDFPNTRNLTKIFMDLVDKIRNEEGSNVVSTIKNNLRIQSSSDEDFEKKLNENVYIENVDGTRFLLCYYEEKYCTKENKRELWEKNKFNKYSWSIEHIFPEGENITDEWVEMIANGDNALAKKYREQYTHKLGNLTLSGYNERLAQMSFIKKRDRQDNDKNYIGYKNKMKLNEKLANKKTWTINDIKTRTNKFVKFFMNEFKL